MPPALAVPPTPPVPLSALLAREDLGLRQIAGPSDPEAVVHWAHASEMADPYPYLLGGELLLTAGVHIPADTDRGAYFDGYVSRIVAAGGAALGFGLAPVHDTVPGALVAACEAHGLPLLEVPPGTTFSGVARAVWQLMERARTAELRRVTEAQQSLATAASRPDPVPSVLQQLAQRVGGRAVLYGPEGTEIAGAGRAPGEGSGAAASTPRTEAPVSAALAELTTVVRPATMTATATATTSAAPTTTAPATTTTPATPTTTAPATTTTPATPTTNRPTTATASLPDAHLSAYALGPGRGFVLGIATPRRAPGDHAIASVAAVLLSLLTGEQQSGSGAARSSALVRLLLGAAPEEVAQLLGDGRRWTVVHAHPDTQPPDPIAASALGTALGSPLVDLAEDVVRVLVPGDREPAPHPGWTLGVSAPVTPAEWPAADTQAARALARARATRAPLVRHGARSGLADLVPPDLADAHARSLLAPLTPALTDTLRAWLSLHGSWDRTAVALGVHRNTVRQRIARCAALLGTDLDDPDIRMDLWFALRDHPGSGPSPTA